MKSKRLRAKNNVGSPYGPWPSAEELASTGQHAIVCYDVEKRGKAAMTDDQIIQAVVQAALDAWPDGTPVDSGFDADGFYTRFWYGW